MPNLQSLGVTTLGGYNRTQDVPQKGNKHEVKIRSNQKEEAIALLVGIPSMEKYGRSCGGEGSRGVSTVGFGAALQKGEAGFAGVVC